MKYQKSNLCELCVLCGLSLVVVLDRGTPRTGLDAGEALHGAQVSIVVDDVT